MEELAAALDLSLAAGLRAGERGRRAAASGCPRLWALVQDGRLQAWKARQVARATTALSRESVAFVDRHLAVTGRHNRIPALNPVLHEARLRCDPDQAAAVEQLALEHRGVWFDHRESTAVTTMTARLDTLDALDLDGTLADLASALGRLGDHRPLDVRRATALGMLAHPQRALDPGHGDTRAPTPRPAPGSTVSTGRAGPSTCTSTRPTSRTPHAGGGSVEKLGTATLDLLRDWLQRLVRGHRATRPRPGPQRRGGRPRRPGLDAGAGDAARRALRVPGLHHRRPGLRPRPPRSRTSRSTRADLPARPHRRTWPACAGDTTG